MAVVIAISLIAILLLQYGVSWGVHNFRVWQNDGKWCALGSPEEGWQFGYGEKECPELETPPRQNSTGKVAL